MALPSAMRVKKEAMAKVHAEPVDAKPVVVLPSMQQVKPVAAAPAEPETELDVARFSVDADSENPVVTPEAVKPTVVTPETEEVRDWKKYSRKHEENWKKADAENAELRARLVELEEKQRATPTPVQAPPAADTSLDWTEDEQKAYADAAPAITKLATKIAKQMIAEHVNPIQQELSELKKTNQGVASKIAAVDANSFIQQVKTHVKNFNDVVSSSEWKDYANQPLSDFTDETIGQALQKAHEARDLGRVTKIFDSYNAKRGTNNVAAAYSSAPVSSANGVLPDSGKKPTLKGSELKKLYDDFKKGRIGKAGTTMSLAQYQKAKAYYAEAEAEGRIDYTK